jgi:excisionase family DNA binding protein
VATVSEMLVASNRAEAAYLAEHTIRWLSYNDIAEITGLSVSTLKTYVAEGKLRAYTTGDYGGLIRFKPADVERLFTPVQPSKAVVAQGG